MAQRQTNLLLNTDQLLPPRAWLGEFSGLAEFRNSGRYDMGSHLVPQRELPGFLSKLEESGRSNIRRSTARFDGMVEVSWDDSPIEQQQRNALLKGWRQLTVISFLVAVLVAAIIVLTSL